MERVLLAVLSLLLFCHVVSVVGAQQSEPETPPDHERLSEYEAPEPPPSPGFELRDVGRVFISLFFIIGLLYGSLYLLRKGWKQRRIGHAATSEMHVLGRLYLGPKKLLYLVEMPSRILVLGVTDHQISLLSQITDEDEILAIKQSHSTDSATPISFLQQLRKNMGSRSQQTERSDMTLWELEQATVATNRGKPEP